ncbi:MAG: rhodanese-like domain-containing protein [Blastocatellia bacterium]
MNIPSLLGRGALILASACLALACSKLAASPNSANTATTPVAATAAPTPVPTQNPEDKMPRISPEEAKKLVDAGKAVIIDVRGPEAYKAAHIKGSLEYALSKIEQKDFSGLPKNKRIIAYCT